VRSIITSVLTCILLVFCVLQSKAQETVGLHLSNFLPATTVQLNPALAVDARTRVDIHLIGAASFFRNNHSFLAKGNPSLREMLGGDAEITIGENLEPGDRKAYVDASVDGPGFAMVKGRSAFVLSTRARTTAFAQGVPFELARFIQNDFDFAVQQDQEYAIENMKVSALSWAEVGVTFGHMLKVTSEEHVNAAITVKRLFGFGMAGLQMSNTNFEVGSGDLMLNSFGGGYAFGAQDGFRPNGWAADFGLIYRKVIDGRDDYIPFSEKSSCQKSRYRYELGISLLDVGGVRFNNNAATVQHSNASGLWEDFQDFDPSDLDQVQEEIANQFESDQNSYEREEFARVSLPTALSVQFDYDFDAGLHLGSVFQQNLRGANPNSLRRANLLSIVPRYERTYLEFALPMTVYEYERLLMGAALRLYLFTIGSDDLLAAVTGDELYGTDFYFSLRIPLYNTSACKPGASSSKKTKIAPCWGQ
jgi:hypothetical protein